MGYKRSEWHSGLTYHQDCYECKTPIDYDDYKLGFRPWFPDGFVYCPKCRTPLRHNEEYAINAPVVEEPAVVVAAEPVAQIPVWEVPAAPAPVVDEPVAPAPVVDEPVAQTPVWEVPAAPAPVVVEPVAPTPVVDEPVVPAPIVAEPVVEAPVVAEPVEDEIPLFCSRCGKAFRDDDVFCSRCGTKRIR